MSPRVSVVMPAFNAACRSAPPRASVLWQTYRDLELVVVDDGSTDGTADVVAALPGPVESYGRRTPAWRPPATAASRRRRAS